MTAEYVLVSISSTFYVKKFCTFIVLAAFSNTTGRKLLKEIFFNIYFLIKKDKKKHVKIFTNNFDSDLTVDHQLNMHSSQTVFSSTQ